MGEPSIQAMGYSGVLKTPPMGPGVEPQKPKLISIEKKLQKAVAGDFFNDRLTARLHVGEKCGFNLHVGVILRPLVLELNGA